MSEEELAALAGPLGLGPDEKVPNQLRILAATENLGRLLSVHRPVGFVSKSRWGNSRVYVYDQGLAVARRDGARMRLFRVGQMRVRGLDERRFLLAGGQGVVGIGTKKWTDGEALGKALRAWAPTHPW
jgi:hypothetical protein